MHYKGHFKPTGPEVFPSLSHVMDCDNKSLTTIYLRMWLCEFGSKTVVK